MFNILKTRKGRLESKIKSELEKESPSLDNIISVVETFQNDNIKTIDKLKKDKKADMTKINGALKQAINAHGPVTKQLIGSAGKRIYGSLILNPNQQEKKKVKISIRDILIGIIIGALIMIVL